MKLCMIYVGAPSFYFTTFSFFFYFLKSQNLIFLIIPGIFFSNIYASYGIGILQHRLEEQFAQQLEEQEAIYGPSHPLPPDLAEPVHHRSSTRSSLSSVSAD